MNQETTFIYNYSAKENKEIQNIRRKYLPREESKLDELKRVRSHRTKRRNDRISLCRHRRSLSHKMKKEVNFMNKNDQEFLVQKIRTQYTEKEHTSLDELKELDTKVKRPASVFAYIFGSVSAIIMGAGMSLVMTDIGTKAGIADSMFPGIVIGVVGMLMAIINYPIYKGILSSRRKKYAEKIIELSDKIMKG